MRAYWNNLSRVERWMSALGANAARRTGHQRNGAGGIRHGDESSGDEFSGDDSA